MLLIRPILLVILFYPAFTFGQAQNVATKKRLTHEVYDSWKSVSGDTLSNNGKYASYTINPQEGDGVLEVVNIPENKINRYSRGSRAAFTADNKYVAFLVKPETAKVRAAKLKKKKPAEMPKDSLFIINLATGTKRYFEQVQSYKLPKEGSGWIAFLKQPQPAAKTSNQALTDAKKQPAPKPVTGGAKGPEALELILLNLESNQTFRFDKITNYLISEKGNKVYFIKQHPDSVRNTAVYAFDTGKKQTSLISKGKFAYKNLATDDAGEQLAFLSTQDSTDKEVRNFTLHYWQAKDKQLKTLADTSYKNMPANWMVSEYANLQFSKNGERLFFGTFPKPRAYEKDTTKLEEEKVSVDIWTWKDPLIQPMQLKGLEREQKRSYVALYDFKAKKIKQLATLEIPEVYFDPDRNADVAIGISDVNYKMSVGYESPSKKDSWLFNLKEGSRRKIQSELRGNPRLSPAGKYVYWYEPGDSTWYTYQVKTGTKTNITRNLPVRFFDELNDVPSFPDDYGTAGWTLQDAAILIYDRYDIWKIDPSGKAKAVNITEGYGRQQNLQFRYVNLDPENNGKAITPEAPFILSATRFTDKASGFYRGNLQKSGKPQELLFGNYYYYGLNKAKNSDQILFHRSTFQEYGDAWATTLDFKQPKKLTTANPQQSEYAWGTVELVHWQSADNISLEGLLYKPENFNPQKKYPLIVYFYERSADQMHRYYAPAPSASTINRTLAVSNDYLIFVPDIVYKTGYPGESAINSIIPGVLSLVQKGFVDDKNMALQGQSWGGYQIAYMVTRSNLFKTAMAGAPVSNMTSAYGGIRWETGISRQFQYERTQSRIGGTLWQKPLLFIENSPLFFADKVETPLLIMANDNDGAVPWYQGIEFFMALRRLQKPVWMLVYNGEAHNLVQRKNRKDLSVRMMQYFDYYLKGAPMPAWMKQGVPSLYKGKEYGFELTEETAAENDK